MVDRLDARHTWRQQRAAAMEEAGAMGIYESCVSVLPNFSQVGGASDQQRGMGQWGVRLMHIIDIYYISSCKIQVQ